MVRGWREGDWEEGEGKVDQSLLGGQADLAGANIAKHSSLLSESAPTHLFLLLRPQGLQFVLLLALDLLLLDCLPLLVRALASHNPVLFHQVLLRREVLGDDSRHEDVCGRMGQSLCPRL